jgi:hypothetical protein
LFTKDAGKHKVDPSAMAPMSAKQRAPAFPSLPMQRQPHPSLLHTHVLI